MIDTVIRAIFRRNLFCFTLGHQASNCVLSLRLTVSLLYPVNNPYVKCHCSYYSLNRAFIYDILVGRPEENRPLGRPRRRWEVVDEIYLAQGSDRCLAAVSLGLIISDSVEDGNFLD
jgi:hypothetical protein